MGEYTDISQMSTSIPQGTDQLSQADDHMRGIKTAIKNTFPNFQGVITASKEDLNVLDNYVTPGTPESPIETRFAAIEEKTDYMTVQQFSMFASIGVNTAVEQRISDLETKLASVGAAEIDGLIGYNTANGYIEDRLVANRVDIDAVIGSPPPPMGTSLKSLWDNIVSIADWQNARTTAANNDQLTAIKTYRGSALPIGYSTLDLGFDMKRVTDKVETLEYLVGTGSNPGLVTWMSLKANLDGGNGGISITNVEGATDRFGFIMTGLEPGTVVDFQFYVDADNAWGGLCSTVNANKLIMVSNTGEAFCDLQLGGANDDFGVGGARLPESGSGRIQVIGLYKDANGVLTNSYQNVYVAYY